MPRLNLMGAPLLSGIGDGVTGRWLNLVESARQDCSTGVCRIVARTEPSGPERELDSRGANFFAAGFGVWAAYLAGSGYRDSHGNTHPSWMPLEVDSSRAVLVTDHDTGGGLWLVRPNGIVDELVPSWVVLDVQQGDIADGVAIYRTGGLVHRWPDGKVFPVPFSDPRFDDRFLCGGGPGGLWFVPWDQPDRALLLSADGRDFNPDICALSNGMVRVVSSMTAGEGPNDLRVYDINPEKGLVNGLSQSFLDVRNLPTPAIEIPEAKRSTRPIGVGCFSEPGGFELTGYDARNKVDGLITDKTRGILITLETDPPEAIDHSTARAIREHLPLYCYLDRKGLAPKDMPAFVGARRLAMLRNTIEPGESRDQANARLKQNLADLRAAGLDVVGDIQLTAPAIWDPREVAARAIDFWNLCVDAGVLAVWCFEWDRADGIRTQPLYQQAVADMRAASADWTVFPTGAATQPIPKPTPAPTPAPHPHEDTTMKARQIYLRSVGDSSKFIGVTKAEHGGLLVVGTEKQAFFAYLFDNRWDENMHVELGINTDVKVMAPGDGGQLSLSDRFGSTLVIKKGDIKGWGLVATGSPVSGRVGRADYHGDDVGQVRTLDPTRPILSWESFEAIDAKSGEVLGPF
ncbi:MAG: hypothetical protein ABI634_02670 [Acidobacteriota bacterium]